MRGSTNQPVRPQGAAGGLIRTLGGLALVLAASACGSLSHEERIWASERQECQEALPVYEDDCLERARKGHVLRREGRFLRWPGPR